MAIPFGWSPDSRRVPGGFMSGGLVPQQVLCREVMCQEVLCLGRSYVVLGLIRQVFMSQETQQLFRSFTSRKGSTYRLKTNFFDIFVPNHWKDCPECRILFVKLLKKSLRTRFFGSSKILYSAMWLDKFVNVEYLIFYIIKST